MNEENLSKSQKRYRKCRKGLLDVLIILFLFVLMRGMVGEKATKINRTEKPENLKAIETSFSEMEKLAPGEELRPEELQIVMVGDMLMHKKVIDSGLQEDGSYNFDHLFTNVKDFISDADIAIVNQETIMGGKEYGYKGYPSFNSPYELADAEVNAGFDVILHATNHTLDLGSKATLNCLNYWSTKHPNVQVVGSYQSAEQRDTIYVYEDKGMKIAVLNYTYGTNGVSVPDTMPYLINLMDKEQIIKDIQKAEEIADFTILCPHWGTEYNLGISSEQEKWTEIFVEHGVDLVIGTHPHVIEPVEWVTHENGNKMLVYYSIGNFVNGTSSTGHGVTNRMVGGIADVTVARSNKTGKVEILEYDLVSCVCHVGDKDAYTVYFLEDYTEEMAKENRILSQDSEFSKKLCQSIVDAVWSE